MTYGEVVLMANNEMLRAVLRHIKNNPEQYDPVRWHRDFAGWTVRLAMPGVEMRKDKDGFEALYVDDRRIWISDIGPWATKLLRLDENQALKLFSGANTLDDIERLVAEFSA
jgi:hypothetical protein